MSSLGVLVKKLISAFLYPLGFSLLMLIGGTLIWHRWPKSRRGMLIVVGGVSWLLLMSLPITGLLLLNPLELEAGEYANPAELASTGLEYVVVLGATVVNDQLSVADRWREEGILRLMEGIRLWKGIPGSKLLLSGGSFSNLQSNPDAMAALPVSLGVPRESLVLETQAADTIDEATLFMKTIGTEKPFALVTSAFHMQRSMEIFRSMGMKPIACPCAFRTKVRLIWYRWFVPDTEGLQNSHLAFHEHLGRVWLYLCKVFIGRNLGAERVCTITGKLEQTGFPVFVSSGSP